MSVAKGQAVKADIVNEAFISRKVNSGTVGILSLLNTNPSSGPAVANAQKAINDLKTAEAAFAEALGTLTEKVDGVENRNSEEAIVTNKTISALDNNITDLEDADIKITVEGIDKNLRQAIIDGDIGGGGGGSSLDWLKLGGLSPSDVSQDGLKLEGFSNLDEQELFATINVPESYKPGKQIKLIGAGFYVNSITGFVFFKAQTALIIPVSHVLGSYPNVHTSTNVEKGALTPANTLTPAGEIDLTDATGKINTVSVGPGDKLRIRLYRSVGTESVSSPEMAKLLINNLELKFS